MVHPVLYVATQYRDSSILIFITNGMFVISIYPSSKEILLM
jgi:hypothetical protein